MPPSCCPTRSIACSDDEQIGVVCHNAQQHRTQYPVYAAPVLLGRAVWIGDQNSTLLAVITGEYDKMFGRKTTHIIRYVIWPVSPRSAVKEGGVQASQDRQAAT